MVAITGTEYIANRQTFFHIFIDEETFNFQTDIDGENTCIVMDVRSDDLR